MNELLKTENLAIEIAHKQICAQLNLSVAPGDVLGILGPNGSGKTTLLHTLAGFIQAESGEIYCCEHNIKSLSAKKRAQMLGFLLQDTQFHFAQTVLEFCLNARYPHQAYFAFENSEDKSIAKEALAIMQLEDMLEQNILTLSGGERRRLAMAALLTQKPTLYLLDEPLNHLDLARQIQVMNHLKHLAETCSAGVILSLHDINFASHYCNKILMLFDTGEFLLGTPRKLINQENLSRLYRHPIQNNRKSWQPQF